MSSPRLQMCVGFCTDLTTNTVALVLKAKGPACVIGKLNGIGGKLEPGETAVQAMVREFREETGVEVPEEVWEPFVTMNAPDYDLHFFVARTTDVFNCRTVESEQIMVMPIRQALNQENLMGNLRWMLPLMQDESVVIPNDGVRLLVMR